MQGLNQAGCAANSVKANIHGNIWLLRFCSMFVSSWVMLIQTSTEVGRPVMTH